jgi:hypothetical protein
MSGSPSFAGLRNKGANRITPETLACAGSQALFGAFVAQPENPANAADSRMAVCDLAEISKEICGFAALRNSEGQATADRPIV